MISRWSDAAARNFVREHPSLPEALALRIYSARLIGAEPSLVLHGGGNTSAKGTVPDRFGNSLAVMWVKGSGGNLATIGPEGHPAIRLAALEHLRTLDTLSDEDMVNELRLGLLHHQAPTPSIEALVHALLPHTFVDHSHADAILALVNQPQAEKILKGIYGPRLAIIPWIMPGFLLSKAARLAYEQDPNIEGLLLLQHGIFTFGETAQQSYERMIAAVTQAEKFIAKCKLQNANYMGRSCDISDALSKSSDLRNDASNFLPLLRGLLTDRSHPDSPKPPILHLRTSDGIRRFVNHENLAEWSQIGPATPDHVIRTKPLPLVLAPVAADLAAWKTDCARRLQTYQTSYQAYFEKECAAHQAEKTMLDPYPRVILIPGIGMITAAQNETAAKVAADVYEHTCQIILDAMAVGEYRPLDAHALFEMEYWSLEQAKLKAQKELPCSRLVVLISGAGSGIGLATAQQFAREGAQLALLDVSQPAVEAAAENMAARYQVSALALPVDITDEAALKTAVHAAVERFGGLDVVICNAGKAYSGQLDENPERLRQSFELNFFAQENLALRAVKVMQAQGYGGCILFNASKAAFNPGPGFGPYAIPKAAVIALMKQIALDYGADGIRCNAVNADRVRTQLFAQGVLETRLKKRGLTEGEYFAGNLLGQEVLAGDVADMFFFLSQAKKTTGATVTVDGGNIAAAPR